MLEDQVGEAHQHAVQLALRQRRTRLAVQQPALAQRVHRLRLQVRRRQPELHLGDQHAQVLQRRAQAGQAGGEQGAHPLHQLVGALAMAGTLAAPAQRGFQARVVGEREALRRQPLEQVVEEVAGEGAAREAVPGRRGAVAAGEHGAGHRQRACGGCCGVRIGRSGERLVGGRAADVGGPDGIGLERFGAVLVDAARRHEDRRGVKVAHQRGEAAERPAALEVGAVGRAVVQRWQGLAPAQQGVRFLRRCGFEGDARAAVAVRVPGSVRLLGGGRGQRL